MRPRLKSGQQRANTANYSWSNIYLRVDDKFNFIETTQHLTDGSAVQGESVVQQEVSTFQIGASTVSVFVSYEHSNDFGAQLIIPDWFIFADLTLKWHHERGISSSTTEIVLCDSYQQIIGMGEGALPLIFAQLKHEGEKPDQWFWALRHITRENPVPRDLWGNRREMAKCWLTWAERNGYADDLV